MRAHPSTAALVLPFLSPAPLRAIAPSLPLPPSLSTESITLSRAGLIPQIPPDLYQPLAGCPLPLPESAAFPCVPTPLLFSRPLYQSISKPTSLSIHVCLHSRSSHGALIPGRGNCIPSRPQQMRQRGIRGTP